MLFVLVLPYCGVELTLQQAGSSVAVLHLPQVGTATETTEVLVHSYLVVFWLCPEPCIPARTATGLAALACLTTAVTLEWRNLHSCHHCCVYH